MERAEVMRIVENELARDPTAGCARRIYFILTLQAAFIRSLLFIPAYRKTLIDAIQVQANAAPFKRLFFKGMEMMLAGKPAEMLFSIYKKGREIGEFLLAEYARGTPDFRAECPRDSLAATVAVLQFSEEELGKTLNTQGLLRINHEDLEDLEDLAVKAQRFVLGEEQFLWFLIEAEDSIAVAKTHPRLARLLRDAGYNS